MSGIKLSLFSQVLALIDQNVVRRLVRQYDTDKYNKGIAKSTHVASMIFMQLAGATSLRDYSNGLRSAIGNLNHLGVTKTPCKSFLGNINHRRTYFGQLHIGDELFEDIFRINARRRQGFVW
jgi:hypothetical protein